MQTLRLGISTGAFQQHRSFKTCSLSLFIQKWRLERGLPMNPNTSGILTDAPDYTYLDGRLTPYGEGQKERILKQRKIKEEIINFTKEIDFAKERYQQLLEAKERKKQAILSSKLKPKGLNLLKNVKKQ